MSFLEQLLLSFYDTVLKMSPWLLFGFFAAGMLSLFFSPEFVSQRLGKRAGWRAIVWAVALGVPLPLCSCGVLPVTAGLRKGGAGKGACAAFLISTPQTGVDSFFATASLLGWAFALIRPLMATLTGLVGGVLVDRLDREPPPVAVTAQSVVGKKAPWRVQFRGAMRYGFGLLFGDIAPALLLGLILSALIMVLIPANFFDHPILGSDWVAFPLMLLIGIPLYVCSTASIPVALALMAKGISPGAALVFLIVGPAMNGASVTMLFNLLGKACTAIHLSVIAGAAVLAGVGLNVVQSRWKVLPDYASQTAVAEGHPATGVLESVCAVVLMGLLLYHLALHPLLKRWRKRSCGASVAGQRLRVSGMTCDHCRATVRELLEHSPRITAVAEVAPDSFIVEGELPETLAADLHALGFELEDER
ncbi:MAG: permease [Kiritimatiellia bacterium]